VDSKREYVLLLEIEREKRIVVTETASPVQELGKLNLLSLARPALSV
jgi:hypothetical protein